MTPDDLGQQPVLEPLSLGDLLDRAIRFYKKYFFKLVGTAAIPSLFFLPMAALLVAFIIWLQSLGAQGAKSPSSNQLIWMGSGLLFAFGYFFLYLFVAMIGAGAGVRIVAENYLGRPTTIGQAYRYIFRRSPGLIWTCLTFGVPVFFGFFMCLLPGVIMGMLWVFSIQVFIMDGDSGFDALRRSKHLAEGNYGRILLVWVFVFVASLVILMLFQYIPLWIYAGVQMAINSQNPAGAAPGVDKVALVMTQFLSLLGQTLAAPLWVITTTLLYFDIRVRKEGYDLELQAGQLGYKDLSS